MSELMAFHPAVWEKGRKLPLAARPNCVKCPRGWLNPETINWKLQQAWVELA